MTTLSSKYAIFSALVVLLAGCSPPAPSSDGTGESSEALLTARDKLIGRQWQLSDITCGPN
jgi:hypothetical protein